MDVFDAMESPMTMRWLSGDPVPDELIDRLIRAGARASSPENSQLWDFVVVRSAEQRARLHEAIVPDISALDSVRARLAGAVDPVKRRMRESAYHLSATLRQAPPEYRTCTTEPGRSPCARPS
ncbi:nitroreductase family protein [Nocardia macrotermitis]|uniref:Nitroreductase domain-containing protein n=1 Tax=Nocardia macrotermitis TaxID=2585198 RepID=A0A7K0D933_9NOCA|nr:nitroreductase family protein [Nocardia macrotermitis]MQY22293.1 hypothetical protein [Nocardia macrotermitis]